MSHDERKRVREKLSELRWAEQYAAEREAGALQVYRLLGLCPRCDREIEKCTCKPEGIQK